MTMMPVDHQPGSRHLRALLYFPSLEPCGGRPFGALTRRSYWSILPARRPDFSTLCFWRNFSTFHVTDCGGHKNTRTGRDSHISTNHQPWLGTFCLHCTRIRFSHLLIGTQKSNKNYPTLAGPIQNVSKPSRQPVVALNTSKAASKLSWSEQTR